MSHFYGTLQGGRGKATRTGHKSSGIVTETASWSGAVEVRAYYNEETETDMVFVALIPWGHSGIRKVLYEGPISGEPFTALRAMGEPS